MFFSVITPTHNPSWLRDTWKSLQMQTYRNFEWIVVVNNTTHERVREVRQIVGVESEHVRILEDNRRGPNFPALGSVGFHKRFAFFQGRGDVLVELDHDDILTPDALEKLAEAFEDPEVGFAYSDFADFDDKSEHQGTPTYRNLDARRGWAAQGFTFYEAQIEGPRPGRYECVRSFSPSAQAFSLVFFAPNHVRAWRRTVYESLGGHDENLPVCDDHDLICRTYLTTRCKHIPLPLYLYRVSGDNTWSGKVDEIRKKTFELRDKYLEMLVLRQCYLDDSQAFDLGGLHGTPKHSLPGLAKWIPVDKDPSVIEPHGGIHRDLSQSWMWWEESSVGAFRAYDFLEHLPDKLFTMREVWRCLRDGGWLLSMTPSTDGRGAFMDPTHVSYWNENSFWYWTRQSHSQYLPIEHRSPPVRFQESCLKTYCPTDWHFKHNIPYVRAELIALKDDNRWPGEVFI